MSKLFVNNKVKLVQKQYSASSSVPSFQLLPPDMLTLDPDLDPPELSEDKIRRFRLSVLQTRLFIS